MYHYNNDAFDTDYPDRTETQFNNSNWSMGPQLRKISPPSLPHHHRERGHERDEYAQPQRRNSFSSPMKHGNPIGSYQRRHRPSSQEPQRPHHRDSYDQYQNRPPVQNHRRYKLGVIQDNYYLTTFPEMSPPT